MSKNSNPAITPKKRTRAAESFSPECKEYIKVQRAKGKEAGESKKETAERLGISPTSVTRYGGRHQISDEEWQQIKQEKEAGMSTRAIAVKHGRDPHGISKGLERRV